MPTGGPRRTASSCARRASCSGRSSGSTRASGSRRRPALTWDYEITRSIDGSRKPRVPTTKPGRPGPVLRDALTVQRVPGDLPQRPGRRSCGATRDDRRAVPGPVRCAPCAGLCPGVGAAPAATLARATRPDSWRSSSAPRRRQQVAGLRIWLWGTAHLPTRHPAPAQKPTRWRTPRCRASPASPSSGCRSARPSRARRSSRSPPCGQPPRSAACPRTVRS